MALPEPLPPGVFALEKSEDSCERKLCPDPDLVEVKLRRELYRLSGALSGCGSWDDPPF